MIYLHFKLPHTDTYITWHNHFSKRHCMNHQMFKLSLIPFFNSGKNEFSKMLYMYVNHFFLNGYESDTSRFYKTDQSLVYSSIANCTASSNRVTISSYVIIYLFELSYLTIKVTLASEIKLILSYFSYNTWTAAIQENREFYIKISNELRIFHPV